MASSATIAKLMARFQRRNYQFPPEGTREELIREWADAFAHDPDADLVQAAERWMRQGRHIRWPSCAELLTQMRQIQDERADRDEGDGCPACAGTGFRSATQHVYERPPHDDQIRSIKTLRVRCDCPKGERAGRLRLTPEGRPDANNRPALSYREVINRCARPTGPFPAVLFVTGAERRWHSADTDPRSPYYSQPSPEERFGPTLEAQRQRAVNEKTRTEGPGWMMGALKGLMGECTPDPETAPTLKPHQEKSA